MIRSYRNKKLDNSENINSTKISRIGLLGRVRKELIKENIIKNIDKQMIKDIAFAANLENNSGITLVSIT